MLVLIFITAVSAYGGMFHQSRYNIIDDHITLDDKNNTYFRYLRVNNMWYNRTTRTFACECDLKTDVTDSWWFDMKMYQFRSNVYQQFTPMNLALKVTEVLSKNYMGIHGLLRANNVPTTIPIPKGKYALKNIRADSSMAPPMLLAGKYKVQTSIYDGKAMVARISWFGSIEEKVNRS